MTQPPTSDTTFTNPDGTVTRLIACLNPDEAQGDDFEFTVPDFTAHPRLAGIACAGGAAWVIDSTQHTIAPHFWQYYEQLTSQWFAWSADYLATLPTPLDPGVYPPRDPLFEPGDVMTVRLGGSARMSDGSWPTNPGGTPGVFPPAWISDDLADIRLPTLGGWNGGGSGGGGADRNAGLGAGGCTEVWRNGDLWIVEGGHFGRAGTDTDIPQPFLPPGTDFLIDADLTHYITGAAVPSASDPPRVPVGPWDGGRTLASPGTAGGPHDGADGSANAGGGGGGFGGGASGGNATATGLPGRHGGSLTPYTSSDPVPLTPQHFLWGAPEITLESLVGGTGGISGGGNGAFVISITTTPPGGWSAGQVRFG